MNCEDVEARLADYLGAELGAEERCGLEAHLAACASCRGEVAGLRAVLGALHELPGAGATAAPAGTAVAGVPRPSAAARRRLPVWVRYAAVLWVGLAAGRLWPGRSPENLAPGAVSTAVKVAVPGEAAGVAGVAVHPGWVRAARAAGPGAAAPRAGSLAEPLLFLARAAAHPGGPAVRPH